MVQHNCEQFFFYMLIVYRYLNFTKSRNRQINTLHRLTERESRLAHYFAAFGGLGLRFGYLATSSAKSDVRFLLGDPDNLAKTIVRTPVCDATRILITLRNLVGWSFGLTSPLCRPVMASVWRGSSIGGSSCQRQLGAAVGL